MKIVTTRDIYVGRYRYHHNPDGTVSSTDFNAIIPDGMNEPIKVPKGTEVVQVGGCEYSTWEDFLTEFEERMFEFDFADPTLKEKFYDLIEYGNITNDDIEFYALAE